MKATGKVRLATAADMAIIKAWLPKDRSLGTLAANWNITMEMFAEGQVSVWEDAASRKPVAYCWGSLNSHSSILEVQPEHRGRGVGRAMAVFMLENSVVNGEPLLEIQIAPEASEPFWQAMGFRTYWIEGYCYGRQILEFRREVPAGTPRMVVVSFLPGHAAWTPDVEPLAVYRLEGTEVPDQNKIELPTTVAHFHPVGDSDLVVEVLVEGRSRYRGKAKYKDAAAIGVQRCKNGFMISEVLSCDALQ
jgi:GNAT superfamily N-acetyltransferase